MTGSTLGQALRAMDAGFRKVGVPYMLIGGLAVIVRGFPRHTDDIDATVLGEEVDIGQLDASLKLNGFEQRIDDAVEFARQNQVLLLRHSKSGIDLDVSFAWLPFEADALKQADELSVEGTRIPVARAEDLLIYKAVAWRERDRRDIVELLRLHRRSMDLNRVRKVVAEFAEVLEVPERVRELEDLIGSESPPSQTVRSRKKKVTAKTLRPRKKGGSRLNRP